MEASNTTLKVSSRIVNLNEIYIPNGIEEGNMRNRKFSDPDVIQKALSMQEIGITNIFRVTLANTKQLPHKCKYEIGDGNGRHAAVNLIYQIALGNEEPVQLEGGEVIDGHYMNQPKFDGFIEVTVDERIVSIEERLATQYQNNFNGLKTQDKDGINALQAIWDAHPEFSHEDLAKFANMPVSQIKKLFKTIKLPDYARDALQENKLSLANAVLLSTVTSTDPVMFESLFADACYKRADGRKGLSQAELGAKITTIKEQDNAAKIADRKAKLGIETGPAVFQPVAKVITNPAILELMQSISQEYEDLSMSEAPDAVEMRIALAKREVILRVCGLDPVSVEIQEAEFNKIKKEKEDAKKQNANKREQAVQFGRFYDLIVSEVITIDAVPAELRDDYKAYSVLRAEKDAKKLEAEEKKAAMIKAAKDETEGFDPASSEEIDLEIE